MSSSHTLESNREARARQYGAKNFLVIEFSARYGYGTDGWVWPTNENTAVKVFDCETKYRTELACYQRLTERNIREIEGCKIPSFRDYDDGLLVIEIGVVSVPYILDFAKAYIDCDPPYSDAQMAAWHDELRELWGPKHYKRVRMILAKLQGIGICNLDAKPGNIAFLDWNDDQTL